MQFFLYEIVARIVAIYLFLDCCRTLRSGLVERKIRYFNPDVLTWFFDFGLADRDTAPIRYWFEIGTRITLLLSCLVVAIFGWWHPDA
jgi:hypothetical protein